MKSWNQDQLPIFVFRALFSTIRLRQWYQTINNKTHSALHIPRSKYINTFWGISGSLVGLYHYRNLKCFTANQICRERHETLRCLTHQLPPRRFFCCYSALQAVQNNSFFSINMNIRFITCSCFSTSLIHHSLTAVLRSVLLNIDSVPLTLSLVPNLQFIAISKLNLSTSHP